MRGATRALAMVLSVAPFVAGAQETPPADAADEWEVHDGFGWGLGTWMALGVGAVVNVSAWNAMTQQSGCNLQKVEVDEREYMKCGNTWYIDAYPGNDVHHVAVEAPVGY